MRDAKAQRRGRALLLLTRSTPARHGRVQKKKIWEAVQPELRTGGDGAAAWKELPMRTAAGPVTVKRILNGNIS